MINRSMQRLKNKLRGTNHTYQGTARYITRKLYSREDNEFGDTW